MIFQRRGWLAIGLGASMALHAFIAFWLARGPAAVTPPAAGSRDAEAIEFQVVPTAGRETPRPAPARVKRGAPSKAVAPVAAGIPLKTTQVARPAVATASAPVEVAPPAGTPGQVAAGAAAPDPAPAPASAPSTAALLAARLSAAALRCYPREAVRFHLSGEARLSFCLGEDGRASAVQVVRSSGFEVLDRAASGCVLPGALPFPGAAGCYELPVRFAAQAR
ncbi:MAG TPA: TonB family protein [Myxococcales bacterium]|jgi:TonB family protein|nr:TonB family protein [Myxococcales bacterium]